MIYLLLVASLAASTVGVDESAVRLQDGRIVGGVATTIEEFPHQVSLQYFSSHRCGGSIISEQWVVTAAHCFDTLSDFAQQFLDIRVGSNVINSGIKHAIETLMYHEDYDDRSLDYDIGVIKVRHPFEFGATIQPISLPSSNYQIKDGLYVTITGWGTLIEGGSLPYYLQRVDVPVVNPDRCDLLYSIFDGLTENMFCAGYEEGGKDACQGDSGGPLIHENTLLGVVSWGYGCARPNYPGVYAHVPVLREWIRSKTGI